MIIIFLKVYYNFNFKDDFYRVDEGVSFSQTIELSAVLIIRIGTTAVIKTDASDAKVSENICLYSD